MRRQGFTLIELLVVIAIIGLLIALLLPAVQSARAAARATSSRNNIKQQLTAIHNAHDVNRKAPPMFGVYGDQGAAGSFFYHLLPFLEERPLHALGPDAARSRVIPVFLHPGDPTAGSGAIPLPADAPWPAWADAGNNRWGLASYGANFGVFGDRGVNCRDISDGLTNTVFIAEKYAVSSRPSGYPEKGAALWGYGVEPDDMNFDGRHWVDSLYPERIEPATTHPYASGYWARFGFVNQQGPVPTQWTGDEEWHCRCHLMPEFGAPLDNVHPLKAQAFGTVINIGMGDGSVLSLSEGITDALFYALATPEGGEVISIP